VAAAGAAEWGTARAEILSATKRFRAAGVGDRRVAGSLRAIERSVHRVDERIGLDL
jgi:hypothetical protein